MSKLTAEQMTRIDGLAAQGWSRRKIAADTGISAWTIRLHLESREAEPTDEPADEPHPEPEPKAPDAHHPGAERKALSTRMLKVQCPKCGCVIRMTRTWINGTGTPMCACGGGQMELAD